MTHPEMEAQIDAYLDGELAATEAAELEAHIAECPACVRFRDERLTLRKAIGAEAPRFEAPAALRSQVRRAIREEAGRHRSRREFGTRARQWLALAATIGAVAIGSWQLAATHTRSTEVDRRGLYRPRPVTHARPPERCRVVRPAHRQALVQRQARFFAAGP